MTSPRFGFKRILPAVFVFAASTTALHAGATPVAGRLGFTETLNTIPPGTFLLQGGLTLTRFDSGPDKLSFGELVFRMPLTARAELRVFGNFGATLAGGARGVEDPAVGLKVKLLDCGPTPGLGRPTVTLIFRTSLPVAHGALGFSTWQPTLKLAVGRPLSGKWLLDTNLIYSRLAQSGRAQIGVTSLVGYKLHPRLLGFAEQYRVRSGGKGTQYAQGGLNVSLSNDLTLDVRAGAGLGGAKTRFIAGVGFVRRW